MILHRGGYGPNKWARIERALAGGASRLREVGRFDSDLVFELVSP